MSLSREWRTWYDSLAKPDWTPPGAAIGASDLTPTFVCWIFASMFVFFNSFGINQVLQLHSPKALSGTAYAGSRGPSVQRPARSGSPARSSR
ncbi:MAG: hypothetical protein WBJ62_10615 [Coriobacteriia bacterium]